MNREIGHLSRPVQTVSTATRIKVLSMGDPSVGKSCIIKRYCEGRFIPEYISTIGIDYGVKTIAVDEKEVKVNFWDVAGDPVYFEIRNEFYKDTHGAILVFDVTSRKSFENLDRWTSELANFCTTDVIMFLVGNKTDLANRVVSTKDGEAFAAKIKATYFEASACTGEGVEDLLDTLFVRIVEKMTGG
ncbi:P-loop containing nucleoside triphosphate hydrolase protein [Zopfochytrium polystomum]|nr:P-loop containing nucleoside triphosphate hydrolase protein [Zopfochytrium polystomum]